MSAEEHQEMNRHMTRGIRHRGWDVTFESDKDGRVKCVISVPKKRGAVFAPIYEGYGATVLSAYEAVQSEMLEAGE